MARIVILSGTHLCHNPRVAKEAAALSRGGFDVVVLGAWMESALKMRDQALLKRADFQFIPVVDLTDDALACKACNFVRRLKVKAGQFAHRFFRAENLWQLGFVREAMLAAARRTKGDLFIAHNESGVAVAHDLMAEGLRVGVDMEDWHSEDLLPDARRYRPVGILRDLERQVLRESVYSSCPSRAMSTALAAEYKCKAPAVIYNAFPMSDRLGLDWKIKDRRKPSICSIHWYSQTIGPGRGLEDLIAALPLLSSEVEVHLRGRPAAGLNEWLESTMTPGYRSRVFIHGLVSNDELLSRIAEHDIGFCGEMKFCRSRELTVTNKLMHYLLAGLAVIASDTDGQREVAAQASGAVFIYPSGRPQMLAVEINRLLESPERLADSKAAALRFAESTFCWERQERNLLSGIAAALLSSRQHRRQTGL